MNRVEKTKKPKTEQTENEFQITGFSKVQVKVSPCPVKTTV